MHVYKRNLLLALRNGLFDTATASMLLDGLKAHAAPAPLSGFQKSIWAIQRTAPDSTAYNIPIVLRVRRALDPEALRLACDDLALQYPALTSIVVERDGVPQRLRHAAGPVRPAILDAPDERICRRALSEEKCRLFDLATGPLWRVCAVRLGDFDWVLMLVVHHVIYDGASSLPMVDALLRFHDDRAAVRIPAFARPEDALADFANAEAAWIDSADGAGALAFWREHLGAEPPVLEMPLDRPRPMQQRYAGDAIAIASDVALMTRTGIAAERHGVARSVWFLAVFNMLLALYCRQEEVVVGIPVSLRPRAAKNAIGNFLNMMPLRSAVPADVDFVAFARRMQHAFGAARDHAAYPYSELVRRLRIPRQSAYSPLFQAVFAYQNFSSADEEHALGERFGATFWPIEHQTGESDIGLEIFQRESDASIHLKYNSDLFDRATAERFVAHYLRLLEMVCDDGSRRVADYLPTTAEDMRCIRDWNATAAEYPRDASLHGLISAVSARYPELPAVTSGGVTLTYAELDLRSDAIARALIARGVGVGELVGICMHRSVDLLSALVGTMKAGAAYVPMDPKYPIDRLRTIIEDSDARHVLVDAGAHAALRSAATDDGRWLEVGVAISEASGSKSALPQVDPEALAYVIYTSGSTGTPKGVMIPHRALVNLLWAMAGNPGMRAGERMLAFATFAFDMSVPELYLPLIVGGECVLNDDEHLRDPDALMKIIAQVRPAVMQATPTSCAMLFATGWRNDERVRVLVGAEPLTPDVHATLLETGTRAWNMYGPTETTVWSTMDALEPGRPITIGKPIANTEVYILDGRGRMLPPGLYGELCIGGDGLAVGYWQRQELTSEKFVSFAHDDGSAIRLYRTGDIARWRADGTLEFGGRSDFQVKLRGYRIELGDIEQQLKSHSAVADAVCVLNESEGARRLVAYCVHRDGAAIEPPLRAWLQTLLPAHMIPAFFCVIPAMPLTPNGKIDRKSLSLRPVQGSGIAARPVLPSAPGGATPIENELLDIWRALLKIEHVALTDGFFEAGGDSVSAVALADRIRKRYGVEFAPSSVFKYPSIRDMAASIAEQRPTTTVADARSPRSDDEAPMSGALAIIGIALRVPGADDATAFWRNLIDGVESIERMDPAVLRRAGVAGSGRDGVVGVRAGISDKMRFDAEFFGISTRDAETMDPQSRLLLQHAWKAVEDAGYSPAEIPDTAVFASSSHSAYSFDGRSAAHDGNPVLLSDAGDYVGWILAQGGTVPTLISHRLGFTGPSMFVHSNCSSSLVGLYAAWRAITAGDARHALIAAATVFAEDRVGYLHQPGLNFSSDGRIRTFDSKADGMVPGEGVVAILVKRADLAIADNDPIYALVRGVGVNNDGAAKAGYYAPSAAGQTAVIGGLLDRVGVDPNDVVYVEAHGTGTLLGDPVEVQALADAYRLRGAGDRYCGIGSVKTNLGHLDTAAGLIGLVKTALALDHRMLPPSLNFVEANPQIQLDRSPFYVVDRPTPIPVRDRPSLAAVSAFGVGGTNAHALLQEPPARVAPIANSPLPLFFPLSAQTAEALVGRCRDLRDFLSAPEGKTVSLDDVARTLQRGRKSMRNRQVFHAETSAALQAALTAFIESGVVTAIDGVEGEAVGAWLSLRVSEWPGPQTEGRRAHLPVYPFAGEIYRLKPTVHAKAPSHPLLHENVSTLQRFRFLTRLQGNEPFLRDHVLEGRPVLPGAAYLEMIREAAVRAFDLDADGGAWPMLRNLVWIRPLEVVDDAVDVHVDLLPRDDGSAVFEVSSGDVGMPVVHCRGDIQIGGIDPVAAIDLHATLAQTGHARFDADACYGEFARLGLQYGPSHRALQHVQVDGDTLLAKLSLPESEAAHGYVVHPGLLDAAFQSAIGFKLADGARSVDGAPVPFSLDGFDVYAACDSEMWVRMKRTRLAANDVVKLDLELIDRTGRICIRVSGLSARFFSRTERAKAAADLLFATRAWVSADLGADEGGESPPRLVLLCGFPAGSAAAMLSVAGPGAAREAGIEYVELAGGEAEALYPEALFADVFRRLKMEVADGSRLLRIQIASLAPAPQTEMALSAMLRTLELECPRVTGQCVSIPQQWPMQRVVAVLAGEAGSDDRSVRYVAETREVAALCEAGAPTGAVPAPWREGGVYLIVGGDGSIARHCLAALAADGRRMRIVSWGRSVANTMETTMGGIVVEHRVVDASDVAAVEAGIASLLDRHGRLDGVLHCAGVLEDGFLSRKNGDAFDRVIASKVRTVLNLDRATAALDIDFFAMFSSVSGYLGNVGQIDYSAASAFLLGYAQWRAAEMREGRRQGSSVAIGWPLWDDGRMRMDEASRQRLEREYGMTSLSTAAGVYALEGLLHAGSEQTMVLAGRSEVLRERVLAPESSGRRMRTSAVHPNDTGASVSPPSAAVLPQGRQDELLSGAEAYLKRLLAKALRTPASKIDAYAPLERYGIDSIVVVDLNGELEKVFGSLSKTLFFEHQTLHSLACFLIDHHGARLSDLIGIARPAQPATVAMATAPAAAAPYRAPTTQRTLQGRTPAPDVVGRRGGTLDIAIIGVAGRYPGAETLDAFWENLREGRDSITEVPPDRWQHAHYFHPDKDHPGTAYTKWGGFIDGVDRFDPTFFNISPREASILDPQERLFLQCVHEAIEDAGYTRQALADGGVRGHGNVGVYVGVMYQEYQLYGAQATALGVNSALPSSPSSIANRVSYFCNFHGPSMAVDTMCSSSMTAIHLACQSLRSGECRVAVAGGVNLHLHPNKYLLLSFGRFASTRGRCESFGAGGDGYVPGEGVGAVVLKPLEQAIADGDHIHGVIRGSSINHGGKTNGFSVPNPVAQSSVISQALRDAGVEADRLSYLEAHGTGTELGDPIEIASLIRAFSAFTPRRGFCPIGSVKSNIGHCESAAGIAALTKVLLQLKHDALVPSLHASTLNPNIDFETSPFYVQRELTPWPRPVDGTTRVCGISSFGAGGSNAHLVIEEWLQPDPVRDGDAVPQLIPLSAKSGEQLATKAAQLRDWLDHHGNEVGLRDLAFTLQVGREAMNHRFAVVVDSFPQLYERLSALADGAPDAMVCEVGADTGIFGTLGRDATFREAIGQWVALGQLERVAEIWLKGTDIDWSLLHAGTRPRRISGLPAYPFRRDRYWGVHEIVMRNPIMVGDATATPVTPATPFDAPPPLRVSTNAPTANRQTMPKPKPMRVLETPAATMEPQAQPLAKPAVRLSPLDTFATSQTAPTHAPVPMMPAAPSPTVVSAPIAPAAPRSSAPAGAVLQFMRDSLATVLMQTAGSIDPDASFVDLGVDSIIGVEWTRMVNGHYGTAIPATAIYDHPTLRRFAALIPGATGAALNEAADTRPEKEAKTEIPTVAVAPASEAAGRDDLTRHLRDSLAEALYLQSSDIDVDLPYVDMGLDSIVGVEWIRAVNRSLGIQLATAVIYDYPTISRLVGHLHAMRLSPPLATPAYGSVEDLLAAIERGELEPDAADAIWLSLMERDPRGRLEYIPT